MNILQFAARAMIAVAFSGSAHAQTEVSWYIPELPPQHMTSGPRAGMGYNDLALTRELIPRLPAFAHKVVTTTLARRNAMVSAGPTACGISLLKNKEREQTMLFSAAHRGTLSPGVLIAKSAAERVAPYVDSAGKLMLARILADGRLKVGMETGRSYGGELDEMLAPYLQKGNVHGVTFQQGTSGLLRMAVNRRVDLVLAYPYEPEYMSSENGDDFSSLSFRLVSGVPEYLLTYLACSKTDTGAAVIAALDLVLVQPGVREAMRDHYEAWLEPEAKLLDRKYWTQAFKPGAAP